MLPSIRKGNFLPENGAKKFPSSIVFFVPFLFHTFGYSSLFLLPTCFSGTKFLSRQSFKLGSKTHARQSPFTPAVQRAMQWSNPYHSVCHLYFLGWLCFNLDEMCFGTWTGISVAPGISPPGKSKKPISHPPQLREYRMDHKIWYVIKWLVCESNRPAQFYFSTMAGTCWQTDILNLPLI